MSLQSSIVILQQLQNQLIDIIKEAKNQQDPQQALNILKKTFTFYDNLQGSVNSFL